MLINQESITDIKSHVDRLMVVINQYKAIVDSHIIEFFVEKHWMNVPEKWRTTLERMQPSDFAKEVFSTKQPKGYKTVHPLSLLAFRSCCLNFGISRYYDTSDDSEEFSQNPAQSKLMDHIFRKHVKPKKQHEIRKLSKVVIDTASNSSCTRIVDIGSGQGHLSRLLAVGYDIRVSSLEADIEKVVRAEKFDSECTEWLLKGNPPVIKTPPAHKECFVDPFITPQNFLNSVDDFEEKDKVLLTGLHACGDLSATMVDTFLNCDKVSALVSIACCYMKLTQIHDLDCTKLQDKFGYPMSTFLRSVSNHDLTYKSRAISCHANECFVERLLTDGDHLKTHCFRAVVESILRDRDPALIRPGVQTMKKAHLKGFSYYAKVAFKKLNLPAPSALELSNEKVEGYLSQWRSVVIYYGLSLMLAPLIESLMLLDRAIFLYENGIESEIKCIFNPELSPRCFALIAVKNE